ncbi:hypothetical protein P9112_013306 [Eukaryota sp. TZLM1-RC]
MSVKKQTNNSTLFLISTFGVYFSFLVYGIFQEKITRKTQYADDERFTSYVFLIFALATSNYCFSRLLISFLPSMKPYRSISYPTLPFLKISLSYVSSMLASNASLLWLSYPTQVLLKSCKIVPVLLAGVIIRKQRYSISKYISVLLVTFGIFSFMFRSSSSVSSSPQWPGVLLGILSLVLDGVTGAGQDTVVKQHNTPALVLMNKNNLFGAIFLFIVSVISGELFSAISFIMRNPIFIWNFAWFAVSFAAGQSFVYLLVANFSSLACSTVTTTRKFFTVLLSVLIFGNNLSFFQWVSVFIVFTGILWEKGCGIWVRKERS